MKALALAVACAALAFAGSAIAQTSTVAALPQVPSVLAADVLYDEQGTCPNLPPICNGMHATASQVKTYVLSGLAFAAISGTATVAQGGTGATTAAGALTNLGGASLTSPNAFTAANSITLSPVLTSASGPPFMPLYIDMPLISGVDSVDTSYAPFNQIYIPSDTVNFSHLPGGTGVDFETVGFYGGSSGGHTMTGGRVAGVFELIQSAATGNSSALSVNTTYAGLVGASISSFVDGGTGLTASTSFGITAGGQSIGRLLNGARYRYAVEAHEDDVTVASGASVYEKVGHQIVLEAADAVQGAGIDAGLYFRAQPGTTPGWQNIFLVDASAMAPGGNLINTPYFTVTDAGDVSANAYGADAAGSVTQPNYVLGECGTECGWYSPLANEAGFTINGIDELDFGIGTSSDFTSPAPWNFTNTTASTSTTTGAIVDRGGLGVVGAGYFGGPVASAGFIGPIGATTPSTGAFTTITDTTPLGAAYGGSGVASPTAHGVLLGEGSSAFGDVTLASGKVLIGQASGDPLSEALSGGATISASGVVTLGNPGASTLGGVESASCSTYQVLTSISASGVPGCAVPGAGAFSATSNPSAPTAPSSTSAYTQMGLGFTLTPVVTGNISVKFEGVMVDNGSGATTAAGTGMALQVRYGTGTAPTFGAVPAGSNCGSFYEYSLASAAAAVGDVVQGWSMTCNFAGTPGTTYWIDPTQKSLGAASAFAVSNIAISPAEPR